ncbi:MAG: benzoate-CoA ligase family protein [Nitriliruptorales bacterium]
MSFEPPERFNIADHFLGDRLAEGRGDRIALRLDDGDLTYAEVDRRARRFGNALRELGVRGEERVFVALPDGAEFVAAFFGILKVGAVVVMVNPDQQPDQLAGLMDYVDATLAVVSPEAVASFEKAAATAREALPRLLVVGGAVEGHASLDDLDPDDDLETVATHRDDPAIWLFSGGTTGRPKAVVQSHTSYANTTELYAKGGVGYREDDITMSVPKLYFGYATGCNLLFPFAVGASAHLFPEHPTPDVLFDRIERVRPTILVNVPSMIAALLDHPGGPDRDLSSVRFATSAGEALPAALYERWQRAHGVELYDGLGTAEMWHIFVSNLPGEVKPGTLGKVVPGFEIAVREDDGADVADGEVGRLWARGNSRAIGYWRNMAETKRTFVGEWVVTGDLVSRDAEGWVRYVGRGDDALKVKGKWLVPAEVEGVLLEHEAVEEAAVVGVEDADGLLRPVAFVVAPGAPDGLEEELREHALGRLEAYKHPRRVVVVDEFPRTHLGKVNRGELRRLAGGQ